MNRVVVATKNPGKVAEFTAALEEVGIEPIGLDLIGNPEEVEETGDTFEANARLKAVGYSLKTVLPVLADDSGIEVDALEGAPGVHSARYGGPRLKDPGRCKLLLKEMSDVPDEDRTARFRCVLALAQAGDVLAFFEGSVEGFIARKAAGDNGFGYDPIFYHPPTDGTFAELSREEKQRFSHRGQAIAHFLAALREGDPRLSPLGSSAG